MRKVKELGTSLLYISHRLEELYTICEKVTILREGSTVATSPLSSLSRLELVALMLGRAPEEVAHGATAFRQGKHHLDTEPLLVAQKLRGRRQLRDVSLNVQQGEIVGLAGLLGSGRSETARLLFGADNLEGGNIEFEGEVFLPQSPREAIDRGIAFVSEDRRSDGIVPELSVRDNLTLAALPSLTKWGIVRRRRQDELVSRFMRELGIKASSPEQKIQELSGGNQQKVLLARWLCRETKLLLLDEPTRGIDVGAKSEIQRLITALAKKGMGVILISSEIEELIEGAHTIVVLKDGISVAELQGEDLDQNSLLRAMAEG